MEKIGKYQMQAESFHCDFTHHLQMGYLGNYMLNAADFHSTDRGFGMRYLFTLQRTWVLSRLCIEMEDMPEQYSHFTMETWVESAMKYFTKRNFCLTDDSTGKVYGYGRSIWALIDLTTRQPLDILEVNDGDVMKWVVPEKECPIAVPGRVKMSKYAEYVRSVETRYSDVDVNSHINSIKYMEHILNLFDIEFYKNYRFKRFDIAYVAESHFGDTLKFYKERVSDYELAIRITRSSVSSPDEVEVVRCLVKYVER